MRCAVIDIGSNTTRLLVAEPHDGGLREVASQRAFTRLGRLSSGWSIPAAKISEVADVVALQVGLARASGAERVRVVATAAIRDAANRDQLCSAVRAAGGVDVDVLSGEEEARLAFAGATGTLRHAPLGSIAVADVGGGSTELVVGTMADGVEWSASFRVGSGFLADHYLHSDPPAASELDAVRLHVAGVFEGLETPPADVGYAVGGSATSLRRLVGAVLDHESIGRAMRVLAGEPVADVSRRFGLHAERVRLLPAGLLLLTGASDALGVPLRISGGGLREGVLLDELR